MYSGVAPRLVGMLLWWMMGARAEIAVALSFLGSFVPSGILVVMSGY